MEWLSHSAAVVLPIQGLLDLQHLQVQGPSARVARHLWSEQIQAIRAHHHLQFLRGLRCRDEEEDQPPVGLRRVGYAVHTAKGLEQVAQLDANPRTNSIPHKRSHVTQNTEPYMHSSPHL